MEERVLSADASLSAVLPARRLAPGAGGVLMHVALINERTQRTGGHAGRDRGDADGRGAAACSAAIVWTRRPRCCWRRAPPCTPSACASPIDVVFVDRQGYAVKIVRNLRPWRIAIATRRPRRDRDGRGQPALGTGAGRRSPVPGAGVATAEPVAARRSPSRTAPARRLRRSPRAPRCNALPPRGIVRRLRDTDGHIDSGGGDHHAAAPAADACRSWTSARSSTSIWRSRTASARRRATASPAT